MGGELGRLSAVVTRVHVPAAALRDVTGQRRFGGGGVPPGLPALRVPAGEAPLVLALAQRQVKTGQGRGLLGVEGEVVAVQEQAASVRRPDATGFYVDTSRNGTRRYCSTSCQNRVKTAAFRARLS